MPTIIKWSEIEAECGSYRDGFVATFRKYEGQPTDEKDGQGRTVKVTANSFARHMGIGESTMYEWIKRASAGRTPARTQSKLISDARRAARFSPEVLVEAINELPEEHAIGIANQIVRKQKERRLAHLVEEGADFSVAGRKAHQAATREALEPLRDALRSLGCMVVVATLEQAAEELRNVIGIDDDERREIDAAVDDVILARTEMHMKLEVL
jgi:hypothetical protein